MNEQRNSISNRATIMNALAVAGFIALIGASMWLAVYSARYVPSVVNRLGAAAVYLGSVFVPSEEPTLSVVPTPIASSAISRSIESPVTSAGAASKPETSKQISPVAGQKTTSTYQIAGAAMTSALVGLPDLIATINAVGYLATSSAESFVASTTVPSGLRPAVAFTIKNIGTNASGPWRFSATIPTQSFYLYQSQLQQSLNPGDSIEYTLGFDQAIAGVDKLISISANFDRAIGESTTDNNNASAKVTIIGG